MLNIEAIKARCEAATKGPWVQNRPNGEYVCNPDTGFNVCMARRSYDAEFIAHAREDIPGLVAEVERLTEGIKEIGTACAKRHDKIKQLEKQLAAAKIASLRDRQQNDAPLIANDPAAAERMRQAGWDACGSPKW